MGHTNSTVNYNLPQFVGTDKPSWLGDMNSAFLAIDTAIAAAKTEADSAAGGVAGLQVTVGSHTTQIGTLTDTVTAQGGTLNSVTALIGNGTPTTTDHTIIGAINELAAIVEVGKVTVTADGVKTQSALLDELFALIDMAKITENAKLEKVAGANKYYYDVAIVSTDIMVSGIAIPTMTGVMTLGGTIAASGSTFGYVLMDGTPTVTITNESAIVLSAGTKLIFHY